MKRLVLLSAVSIVLSAQPPLSPITLDQGNLRAVLFRWVDPPAYLMGMTAPHVDGFYCLIETQDPNTAAFEVRITITVDGTPYSFDRIVKRDRYSGTFFQVPRKDGAAVKVSALAVSELRSFQATEFLLPTE